MNRLAQWMDDEMAKATCEHDFANVERWPEPAFVCVKCGTKSYPQTRGHRNDLRHMPDGRTPGYVRLLKQVHDLEMANRRNRTEAELLAAQAADAERIAAEVRRMEVTP